MGYPQRPLSVDAPTLPPTADAAAAAAVAPPVCLRLPTLTPRALADDEDDEPDDGARLRRSGGCWALLDFLSRALS